MDRLVESDFFCMSTVYGFGLTHSGDLIVKRTVFCGKVFEILFILLLIVVFDVKISFFI